VSEHATSRKAESGQVLVIVAVGLVALLAMVGLVVDGGYAWGKQRDTQNASDASAEAGAVVMAERLAGINRTDAQVWAAVQTTGDANGLPPAGAPAVDPTKECHNGQAPDGDKPGVCAYYTNISGDLVLDGSGKTIAVGSLGAPAPPTGSAGVRAFGRQRFNTFLMRLVGFQTLSATAPATAVAGYVSELCPASLGCAVIPVTFPVTIVTCDGTGSAVLGSTNYLKNTVAPYVVPLCKNNPGNVGWIDWDPPAGGTAELEQSILYPDNPDIPVPSWQYVTSTGNVNSAKIEAALNTYAGQTVLIPQFDATCNTQPAGTATSGCPAGHVGGNGQNQWYHLPQFAAFQFCGGTPNVCPGTPYTQGAYVNGNNKAICDTGNGATSCLVGRFIDFLVNTTVTGNVGANSNTGLLGVQLIR
jgi:hypothetical protein